MKINASAESRHKPSLKMVFIPRCPKCLSGNPKGFDHCPVCGEEAPMQRLLPSPDEVAMTGRIFPWYAVLFIKIGAWLRTLARKIEGN